MVMRGITSDGQPLHFRREYLKHGIRGITEDLCTRQIGYRTLHDAAEAERREISEKRVTALDRAILRDADQDPQAPDSAKLAVVRNPAEAALTDSARRHSHTHRFAIGRFAADGTHGTGGSEYVAHTAGPRTDSAGHRALG